MKTFIVFFTCLVAVFAVLPKDSLFGDYDYNQQNMEMLTSCLATYNIDTVAFQDKIFGEREQDFNDVEQECLLSCLGKINGVFYDDGSVNKAHFQQFAKNVSNVLPKIRRAVASCKRSVGVYSCDYLSCVTTKVIYA